MLEKFTCFLHKPNTSAYSRAPVQDLLFPWGSSLAPKHPFPFSAFTFLASKSQREQLLWVVPSQVGSEPVRERSLTLWEMAPWGPGWRPVSLWPKGGSVHQLSSFSEHHLGTLRVTCGLSLLLLPPLCPTVVLSHRNVIIIAIYLTVTFQ